MQLNTTAINDLLNVLIQLLIVVLPVVVTWFIRMYVKNTSIEPKVAVITRLANSAIDYVENLDKRGDLSLPPGARKGTHKLQLAGEWLIGELERQGINMTDDEAKKWVASEFQKRMGGVQSVDKIATVTKTAVEMIQTMIDSKLVNIPPEVDRFSYLAGLAADWVIAQLAENGTTVTREQALTWVRAELFNSLQIGEIPTADPLDGLVRQAISFLEEMKAQGKLTIQPGASRTDVEIDIATAWVLTEATKQGLSVTPDRILQKVTAALKQRNGKELVKSQ